MSLTSIGKKSFIEIYKWIPYNGVLLDNSSVYALYIDFLASTPELIYSVFALRIRRKIKNGIIGDSLNLATFQYESSTQIVILEVQKYWDSSVPSIIQIKRDPIWENLSSLANCEIELKIDLQNKL